ncbi:MAG TPA: CPBP family intramembrane glutamic endopeptidase, partial [Bacteroidia bacterium]|nr:CPBP family intramembrane glutamic endopeptidase [Bacteroidia bacterium]
MQNIEKERYSWLKLGAVMLWILIWALPNIFVSDTKMNFDDVSKVQILKLGQAIGVIFLFIIPSVVFAQFATKSKMSYLGITKPSASNTTLIAGLGMVLALPLINGLAQLNQQVHFSEAFQGLEGWMKNSEENAKNITEAFLQGTDLSSLLINLFVIAFMAALSEELFFRGVLQNVLIDCFKNKHVGVWVGAIIFSAFHLQFYGFLPRILMGAYLGYLLVWTGSLWPG